MHAKYHYHLHLLDAIKTFKVASNCAISQIFVKEYWLFVKSWPKELITKIKI